MSPRHFIVLGLSLSLLRASWYFNKKAQRIRKNNQPNQDVD